MLFLECNADEVLARAVGVPRREIVHSHGKGRVSKNLKERSGAIGLVDQDLGSAEPTTLSKFREESNCHDLILKLDRGQKNRLVIVCPRLEGWIIQTAKAAGARLADFSLAENPNELHADINHRLPNLKRLLRQLLEMKSPRLLHLRSLLLG